MRIAIMGAGGIGGYYGAKLAAAGNEVVFIARGAHLDAIRAGGFSLVGPAGDIHLPQAVATDDPSSVAPVDVVLFCVKLFDTEAAARAIAPLLDRGGICISLQNGVDGQHRIGAVVGAGRVLGGLAFVSAVIEAPGRVRYNSANPALEFGEADGSLSDRARHFREACLAAGFGATVVKDIRAAQWSKFVGLSTNAALTALVRRPAGVIYRDPELLEIARQGFAEAAAVARAMGIDLPVDIVEAKVKQHQGFPADMYASMYHDLSRGKRLELESLSGLVVRKGRELGVPTPVHEMAYACLKPFLDGNAG
jgi:2-dehydropantoate 2-reductase